MTNSQCFDQKSISTLSRNPSRKRLVLLVSSLLISSIFLSGCATTFNKTFNKKTGAFRNRELDYLHQPVSQNPALIIPQNIEARNMKPKNTLPAGPMSYPAEDALDMTPPGFNQKIIIPTLSLPTAKNPSGQTSANQTSKKQNSEAIKAQIAQIQTQIQNLKNQQEVQASTTPSHTAEISSENKSAPLSGTQDPKGTQTVSNPSSSNSSNSSNTFDTSETLPQITSSLTFDSNNTGLLTINAPYAKTWDMVQTAVKQSGYQVSKTDSGSHLIYVTENSPEKASEKVTDSAQASSKDLSKDPLKNQRTFLLFINRKDNSTQVSIFTDKGILDSSAEAYSLLSQIHSNLSSAPSS
jgi:uncharacterized lipoprotein